MNQDWGDARQPYAVCEFPDGIRVRMEGCGLRLLDSTATPEQALALQMIVLCRQDYKHPEMRGEIESWLYGDPAPLSFDDVCWLLGVKAKEPIKRWIREGSNTVAGDQEESSDGSLAADRERFDGAGDTGPEWLLSGAGSVDRVESSPQSTKPVAEKLAQDEAAGRRACLGNASHERVAHLRDESYMLSSVHETLSLGPNSEAAV